MEGTFCLLVFQVHCQGSAKAAGLLQTQHLLFLFPSHLLVPYVVRLCGQPSRGQLGSRRFYMVGRARTQHAPEELKVAKGSKLGLCWCGCPAQTGSEQLWGPIPGKGNRSLHSAMASCITLRLAPQPAWRFQVTAIPSRITAASL